MGAHGLNLPWRALKLGAPVRASVKIAEPLKDSYPSASDFRWDFAAREGFEPVTVWWHDGPKAGPPEELGKELLSTYGKVPTNGVLFAGEKGILCSNAWGVGGVVRLKGDEKCRGVLDHEAGKSIPVTLPRAKDHMREWLDACKGEGKTFQGFDTSACVAEVAMVGMVAMRLGQADRVGQRGAEGQGRAGRRAVGPPRAAQEVAVAGKGSFVGWAKPSRPTAGHGRNWWALRRSYA